MQVESDPNQNLNQDEQKVANYLTQGFSLFKAKNYPEAIKAFNEVIRIQPNNQYAYFGRGVSNYLLEKYQQAKTDLDKSIELDSSLPLAYFFRGITNSALGNKDNAITDLETAAKLFEKDGNTELAQTSRDVIKRIRNA
ncbi:tetratricopeptide repeat protein [Rivularia sp. UHCC 0363]|uniref:tetratricopeptide repeat protein n=1 Tax=Rivularia sp. UHCC 0363 TaxID=3110244 RepID=UPI002B21F151|nr:tetratricopeptide repeat protein [Rivularia sp. UHCC 0363]MEA5595451.1 tetratricopeptide repeat protein [Rivularia sp. UHCC 0363]